MNNKSELQKLVIRNLAILEAAPAVVAEIQQRIFDVLNAKLEKWVGQQDTLQGVYKYPAGETTFAALDWPKTTDGDYAAYITLGCENDGGYHHCLSPLLGVLPEKFGLWFCVDARTVTGLIGKGSQPGKAWGTFLAEWYSKSQLGRRGLTLQAQSLFLPISICPDTLANNYPESVGVALEPFDFALGVLRQVIPELNKLLMAADSRFDSASA